MRQAVLRFCCHAIDHLDAHAGPDGAKELVIVRNGRMIWAGPNADAYHPVFSCTKTFTSTVLGLLVEDGKCSLDSPAVTFEPRLADEYPVYAKIKLRHLASMCGGYQGEVKDIRKEDQLWGDVMAYLNPRQPYFEAGTAVQYNDHDVFLLGKILTLLVREPLQDVFQRRIAGAIGMTKWEWGISGTVEGIALNNPPGNPGGRGAGGIKTTPREMARLGLLMLSRGNWNGKQLLSASFVDEATSNRVPVSVGYRNHDFRGRYGYYWWVNGIMANGKRPWPSAPPKTYMSHGNGGNFCCIVPEWNLVLVRMGSPRVSDQLWDAFFAKLAAAISSNGDSEARDAKPALSQGDTGATERVGQGMNVTTNLAAAIGCVLATGTVASAIEPANSHATSNTRKVLAYLYELPNRSENRIVSGHLAGGAVGPNLKVDGGFYKFTMEEIDYLHQVSGQWVGLIGADYCAGWLESPNPVEDSMYYTDLNRGLIDYWNAGGLVAITTHQFDPRELHKDGGQCFFKDLPKGVERVNLSRLYTPGCEEYDNFRIIMDRWSEGLQELADHDVVVLWRPFNEARDGKWWCLQPVDQFKALYRYTFDYLTRVKGLNNLLWVSDPVRSKEDLAYYPGDDCVDIVGDTMNWDSGPAPNATRPLSGKVFGCIEFNVRADLKKLSPDATPRDYDYTKKLNWVKEQLPYCSFFMSWNNVWGPFGRGTPESVKAMYNDPSVANRGELDWRKVAGSAKSD